jgi:capsular exopolysaccharide synthesis family protein
MSRLGAALERAATGAVARRDTAVEPAPIDLPVHASAGFEIPVAEPEVEESAPAQGPGVHTKASPGDPVPDGGRGQFREFHREYVDKLVVSNTVPQALREQYRRLAANLHHAQEEAGIKTLMVTSAVPDEGKTLTATNVALTLSESYRRRVLLIDADLRRPSLDDVFMLPKGFGLNEALTGRADRKVSIIQVSRNLSLLPAGAPDSDPMSKLTSDRMRNLIREASTAFEWVIMDTPPIGILTDAKLLGAMVDGALLVVRAGRTPANLIQRAVDSLGKNRILGVVLNRAERRGSVGQEYKYDESYYYASSRKRTPEKQ